MFFNSNYFSYTSLFNRQFEKRKIHIPRKIHITILIEFEEIMKSAIYRREFFFTVHLYRFLWYEIVTIKNKTKKGVDYTSTNMFMKITN